MRAREELEQREACSLAPYAMASARSRGRAYSEAPPAYRTHYQRDRDRIIHSSAFRRLEYKTQVFVNHEGDHYRTRLTHTMEVAQIARTIGRVLGANEDLIEAIALAHDVGHTPFGHAGEQALRALMAGHGGFEHNLNGLRVVDRLEQQYPDFPGLNLTYEVREAIAKHSTAYDRPEVADFDPDRPPTLEAQIVEVADSVAYDSHDIDDGLYSGVLDGGELLALRLPARAWGEVEARFGEGVPSSFSAEKPQRRQLVRRVINIIVTDLVRATDARLREVAPGNAEDIRRMPERVVVFSGELAEQKEELEAFLMERFYRHFRLARMARKAKRMLTDMFHTFVAAPDQLPPEYARRTAREPSAHQAVCDYIAGMTDRYARQEYRRLFSPDQRA